LNDPLELDAMGQAELVASGEVSSLELVEASIAKIEALDDRIGALSQRYFDEARGLAKDLAKAPVPGPFSGVPFLVKDFFCHMEGKPTCGGSRLLRDNIVDHDSELMRRYRAAGFVTLGKTNVPEFVSLGTTEPVWPGPTRNPWDLTRSPGGSSGGAAAAVAARYVAAAHANDGAGSTRIPAACCGLYGLKPSRARVTLGPHMCESIGGITAEHVVTRSVRDSAAILDTVHGPMSGDPYCAPQMSHTFLDAVGSFPNNLRIALTLDPPDGSPLDADVREAVLSAAKLAVQLGHHVEVIDAPYDGVRFREVMDCFWPMTVTRAIVAVAQERGIAAELLAEQVEPLNRHLFNRGITRRAVDYMQDLVWFQSVTRGFGKMFETWDIWLTPVQTQPPAPLGFFSPQDVSPAEAWDRVLTSFLFTSPANVAGLPAASLPLGWSRSGLPIGVQLTGKYGDEMSVLSLSAQFEDEAGFLTRNPLGH